MKRIENSAKTSQVVLVKQAANQQTKSNVRRFVSRHSVSIKTVVATLLIGLYFAREQFKDEAHKDQLAVMQADQMKTIDLGLTRNLLDTRVTTNIVIEHVAQSPTSHLVAFEEDTLARNFSSISKEKILLMMLLDLPNNKEMASNIEKTQKFMTTSADASIRFETSIRSDIRSGSNVVTREQQDLAKVLADNDASLDRFQEHVDEEAHQIYRDAAEREKEWSWVLYILFAITAVLNILLTIFGAEPGEEGAD